MDQWYCSIDGQRYGPVEADTLREWIRQGRVGPTDHVWRQGMADWARAGETFGEMFAATAAAGDANSMVPAPPPGGTGGQTPNAEITRQARDILRGRWGLPIAFNLLLALISTGVNIVPYLGGIASLVVSGPLTLGAVIFFLTFTRRGTPQLNMLFAGFKNFTHAFGAYALMGTFIFLWALLLIIPGIIAAFRYSQTFYLLADDKALGPLEAIRASKRIMDGRKWKLFCLHLRFLAWSLPCLLTLGIGFLWLVPYINTSCARFYDDLRPAASAAPVPAGVAAASEGMAEPELQ